MQNCEGKQRARKPGFERVSPKPCIIENTWGGWGRDYMLGQGRDKRVHPYSYSKKRRTHRAHTVYTPQTLNPKPSTLRPVLCHFIERVDVFADLDKLLLLRGCRHGRGFGADGA